MDGGGVAHPLTSAMKVAGRSRPCPGSRVRRLSGMVTELKANLLRLDRQRHRYAQVHLPRVHTPRAIRIRNEVLVNRVKALAVSLCLL